MTLNAWTGNPDPDSLPKEQTMNTEQPLALKLALHLRGIFISEEITAYKAKQIASELERLHAEVEQLKAELAGVIAARDHAEKIEAARFERFMACKAENEQLRQQLAGRGEPVAFALHNSRGIEFNSKYPMCKTREQAEEMSRLHLGKVSVVPLYTAPPDTDALLDQALEALEQGAAWKEGGRRTAQEAIAAIKKHKGLK